MKSRDIFGVIVRTIGLCLLLFSLWYLIFALAVCLQIVPIYYGDEHYFANFVFPGIPSFIIALLLLRYARHVVGFCYPKDKDDTDT